MRKITRCCLIAAVLAVMMLACCPARADVMTVGIWFCGTEELQDGTLRTEKLTGDFTVTVNGEEIGRIRAGEETLTVNGPGRVTVRVCPETAPEGWDLSHAAATVEIVSGGSITIPVTVKRSNGENQAADAGMPADRDEDGTEDEDEGIPAGQNAQTAGIVTASIQDIMPTPVITPAPTEMPEIRPNEGGTGTILVLAFLDNNNNGELGTFEKSAAGISVFATDESGTPVAGAVTDSEGLARLTGLTPGTYRLLVSLPDGYIFNKKSADIGLHWSCTDQSTGGVQESEPIRVAEGMTVERGIGVMKGLQVTGTCWLDVNGDGIMTGDEPKMPAVRVTMKGQKNGLEYETRSDENGDWIITRVRPAFYDLTGYVPDGFMFTRYSREGRNNRSIFTAEGRTYYTKTLDLNDNESEDEQNIGFMVSAKVTGIVFLDENYNGLYDEGEKPMAGVKVTAIKQVADDEIAVAVSGEDGRYTLKGLRGRIYKIRALLPNDGCNFTRTVSDPLGNRFEARDNRRENFWKDFALTDGEIREVNVGVIYYGSVSGTVYTDEDFSATMNGSEKPAQGIEVTLLDEKGSPVETKRTNAKGAYSFTGLTPGQYSLRMMAKEGYAFTKAGENNVILNRNRGEGYSEPFRVPLGQAVEGMDAGMIRPGTVEGFVFADKNDNGVRDAGENGLSGTVVRLMGEEGEAFSAVITESGSFLFDAVMPGRYRLRYELPENAVFAKTAAGGNTVTGENGAGESEEFSIGTGDYRSAPLCGALTLGRITGTAFRDGDGSGTMDGEESTLPGVEITLQPTRPDLEPVTVITETDGTFALTDLHPDSYKLTLGLPENRVTARTGLLTLPLATGRTQQTVALDVPMGGVWVDQMIGCTVPGSLRGKFWLDENNNGLCDEDEQTPEGCRIVVIDEGDGTVTDILTTDTKGVFASDGMIPGTFTLAYEMPDNTDAAPEGDSTFRAAEGRMEMAGISVKEGSFVNGLMLGVIRYTTLEGRTWIDRGNGDENLADAAVTLTDADGNRLSTQITGETGRYAFAGLLPGTYRIEVKLPEGCVAAEPDDERLQGGLTSVIEETDGRNGRTGLIRVRMGEDQTALHLGSVLPGTIGDYCWLDTNGNGFQDGGEYGLPNVKIELLRNGAVYAETVSDEYGLYFFREVYPAVYTLRVTPPEQVKPTKHRTDIPLIVSSLEETDEEVCYTGKITVQSDKTDFNHDLGFVCRKPGVLPGGLNEGATQDWSKRYREE
ncbi:MAG: carboxypeptidase regulatory-like domain-containing protein [Clostridia bacterium]|nr:carboxypeptidase regulatory-like domain-containing protein [Clostridia bacterium]